MNPCGFCPFIFLEPNSKTFTSVEYYYLRVSKSNILRRLSKLNELIFKE